MLADFTLHPGKGSKPCFDEIMRIVNQGYVKISLRDRMLIYYMKISILLAAVRSRVGLLVKVKSKHFPEDPKVAQRSGLRIGTTGDALAWVREQLSKIVK
jgi:hypothetical protein